MPEDIPIEMCPLVSNILGCYCKLVQFLCNKNCGGDRMRDDLGQLIEVRLANVNKRLSAETFMVGSHVISNLPWSFHAKAISTYSTNFRHKSL